MKLYKSFMFSALAAVAALATSCSDEGYWDGYTPESPEYSFAQATNSYKYLPTDDIPTSYELKVYRNNNNGEVALPLVVDYAATYLAQKTLLCLLTVAMKLFAQLESTTLLSEKLSQ